MMQERGARVTLDKGLCKLTLTAPCCHLLELLESTCTYVCFTWDNIRKHIREHQQITVVRCINVKADFNAVPFISTTTEKTQLPSTIFQYYAADPTEDDTPITMAPIFRFCSVAKLNSQLAVCLERGLLSSATLTENFCYRAWLKGTMLSYSNDDADCDKLILIRLVQPKQDVVHLQWSYKLQVLLWKRLQLEDAMNWLNTLGGGYSALGDYFERHAIKAAEISGVQLKVALELGDPPTVIRCHLYLALSLMQRTHLRCSKYMLRYLYRCALTFSKTDPRLLNMCFGLWSRLRYFYSVRYRKQQQQRQYHEGRKHGGTNGLVALTRHACVNSISQQAYGE